MQHPLTILAEKTAEDPTRQTSQAPSVPRAQNPLRATRTCNKVASVHMYTGKVLMDLDRGTLAKIDRRVLSGLDREESYQMVRVPVSKAVWSTWRRYCDALEISMGRAIIALVQHELCSVLDGAGDQPVFLAELEGRFDQRQSGLDAREHSLQAREHSLLNRQGRAPDDRVSIRPPPGVAKVGRNDRCPCGSGIKYKRCHGS